jgi:hypothetical protein
MQFPITTSRSRLCGGQPAAGLVDGRSGICKRRILLYNQLWFVFPKSNKIGIKTGAPEPSCDVVACQRTRKRSCLERSPGEDKGWLVRLASVGPKSAVVRVLAPNIELGQRFATGTLVNRQYPDNPKAGPLRLVCVGLPFT